MGLYRVGCNSSTGCSSDGRERNGHMAGITGGAEGWGQGRIRGKMGWESGRRAGMESREPVRGLEEPIRWSKQQTGKMISEALLRMDWRWAVSGGRGYSSPDRRCGGLSGRFVLRARVKRAALSNVVEGEAT